MNSAATRRLAFWAVEHALLQVRGCWMPKTARLTVAASHENGAEHTEHPAGRASEGRDRDMSVSMRRGERSTKARMKGGKALRKYNLKSCSEYFLINQNLFGRGRARNKDRERADDERHSGPPSLRARSWGARGETPGHRPPSEGGASTKVRAKGPPPARRIRSTAPATPRAVAGGVRRQGAREAGVAGAAGPPGRLICPALPDRARMRWGFGWGEGDGDEGRGSLYGGGVLDASGSARTSGR